MKPTSAIKRGFQADDKILAGGLLDQAIISSWLKQGFNLDEVSSGQQIQSLWSGYGDIVQFKLLQKTSDNDVPSSVIAKWVSPPTHVKHPRGWQSDLAHQRKLSSYLVEKNAYGLFNKIKVSENWPEYLHIPDCYQSYYDQTSQQQVLLLEDLNLAGFPLRYSSLTPQQTLPCIKWLAGFHAYFLQDKLLVEKETSEPRSRASYPPHFSQALIEQIEKQQVNEKGLTTPFGLWPIGSYWHLATRPDEWQAMADSPLKQQASQLDDRLNSLRFSTQIHGDAKVANFCFSNANENGLIKVAALDFQYMGAGCGMKDLVYFLGSCLTENDCEQHWQSLLEAYFRYLRESLNALNAQMPFAALETEWRLAFELAWADFQRFLEGWSPDHKKNTGFSRAMTQKALSKL